MQGIPRRGYDRRLESKLRLFPAVVLLGPRQCGKATLARSLPASRAGKRPVFDLERPSQLARLRLAPEEDLGALQRVPGLIVIEPDPEGTVPVPAAASLARRAGTAGAVPALLLAHPRRGGGRPAAGYRQGRRPRRGEAFGISGRPAGPPGVHEGPVVHTRLRPSRRRRGVLDGPGRARPAGSSRGPARSPVRGAATAPEASRAGLIGPRARPGRSAGSTVAPSGPTARSNASARSLPCSRSAGT